MDIEQLLQEASTRTINHINKRKLDLSTLTTNRLDSIINSILIDLELPRGLSKDVMKLTGIKPCLTRNHKN